MTCSIYDIAEQYLSTYGTYKEVGACFSQSQLFFIITEKQIGVSISLHVGVLMCSCRLYYMQHATINLIQNGQCMLICVPLYTYTLNVDSYVLRKKGNTKSD